MISPGARGLARKLPAFTTDVRCGAGPGVSGAHHGSARHSKRHVDTLRRSAPCRPDCRDDDDAGIGSCRQSGGVHGNGQRGGRRCAQRTGRQPSTGADRNQRKWQPRASVHRERLARGIRGAGLVGESQRRRADEESFGRVAGGWLVGGYHQRHGDRLRRRVLIDQGDCAGVGSGGQSLRSGGYAENAGERAGQRA